jgi:hypothetical protein
MNTTPNISANDVELAVCSAPTVTPAPADKVSICQGGVLSTATAQDIADLATASGTSFDP